MNEQTKHSIAKIDEQYYSIDLARLACSLLVITIHVHVFGHALPRTLFSFLNFGVSNYLARAAVPLLFCFSGFFLYRKTRVESFSIKPTNAYIKRIIRLYIVWSICYFPFTISSILRNPGGVLCGIIQYLRSLIFLGTYEHLWFFPALILSVLLVSTMLLFRIRIRIILSVSFAFFVVGVIFQSWYGLFEPLLKKGLGIEKAVQCIFNVMGTTRNGLFEGFFRCVRNGIFTKKNTNLIKGFFDWLNSFFLAAFRGSIVLAACPIY